MKTFKLFITEVKKSTIIKNRETRVQRRTVNPNYIESEKGEFERYPNATQLMRQARTSPIRNLSTREVANLQNTDASGIRPGAQGRRNARRLAREYGRDINRVIKQIKAKTDEPSIVMNKGGQHELVGGNTRAMVRRSMGKPVRAIIIGNK